MTSSVPAGQTDADDWFDLDKYKKAAGVAYEFSKKKMETAGEQERETIGSAGKAANQRHSSSDSTEDEKRDYDQANELIDIELFDTWVDNLDAATQERSLLFAQITTQLSTICMPDFLDTRQYSTL